eukprot:341595-Chlamydomonas_euryale.AAC.1
MYEAGLPPGPRALHCLIFAHVRAGGAHGGGAGAAMDAARRMTDAGQRLLPETYVVLIYALLGPGSADADAHTGGEGGEGGSGGGGAD